MERGPSFQDYRDRAQSMGSPPQPSGVGGFISHLFGQTEAQKERGKLKKQWSEDRQRKLKSLWKQQKLQAKKVKQQLNRGTVKSFSDLKIRESQYEKDPIEAKRKALHKLGIAHRKQKHQLKVQEARRWSEIKKDLDNKSASNRYGGVA